MRKLSFREGQTLLKVTQGASKWPTKNQTQNLSCFHLAISDWVLSSLSLLLVVAIVWGFFSPRKLLLLVVQIEGKLKAASYQKHPYTKPCNQPDRWKSLGFLTLQIIELVKVKWGKNTWKQRVVQGYNLVYIQPLHRDVLFSPFLANGKVLGSNITWRFTVPGRTQQKMRLSIHMVPVFCCFVVVVVLTEKPTTCL